MAIASAAGVARLIGRLPGGMTLERGEQIHDFVRARRPSSCLELGTANGVGALSIGSALEANGFGTLTSVDKRRSAQDRRPLACDLVHEAGLSGRVTLVHEETSYTWFLHDTLRAQLKADGEVEPKYDFVYIDGAHTWDVDALAFALADRLLVPGGWILFDDLDWVLDARWPNVPDYQRSLAQSRTVRFERVVDPVGERYEFSAEASRARTPTLAAPAPHYEHSGGASPTSATTSCSPTPIPRPR